MGTGKTTADDRVWQATRRRIAGIGSGPSVKVGIVGEGAGEEHDDDEGGKITNAELGALIELGTVNMPARSFIRYTFELKAGELHALQKRLARALFLGTTTVEKALGLLGAWGAGAIKATITQGLVVPRLEDSEAGLRTIARKGSSRTLVDTGQLVNSITWVKDGGHGGGEHSSEGAGE